MALDPQTLTPRRRIAMAAESVDAAVTKAAEVMHVSKASVCRALLASTNTHAGRGGYISRAQALGLLSYQCGASQRQALKAEILAITGWPAMVVANYTPEQSAQLDAALHEIAAHRWA